MLSGKRCETSKCANTDYFISTSSYTVNTSSSMYTEQAVQLNKFLPCVWKKSQGLVRNHMFLTTASNDLKGGKRSKWWQMLLCIVCFIRTASSLLFHWVMWMISPVLMGPKPHPLQKIADLQSQTTVLTVLRKYSILVIMISLHTLDSCELHLKMRESAINLVLLRKNQVYIRINYGNMKIFITRWLSNQVGLLA